MKDITLWDAVTKVLPGVKTGDVHERLGEPKHIVKQVEHVHANTQAGRRVLGRALLTVA